MQHIYIYIFIGIFSSLFFHWGKFVSFLFFRFLCAICQNCCCSRTSRAFSCRQPRSPCHCRKKHCFCCPHPSGHLGIPGERNKHTHLKNKFKYITANQSLVQVCAQSVPGRHNFSRPKLSAFYVEIGLKKIYVTHFEKWPKFGGKWPKNDKIG